VPQDCIDGAGYDYDAETLVLWQIADFGINTAVSPPFDPDEQAVKDLIDSDNAALVISAGDNDYVGDYQKSVEMQYGEWVNRKKFWPVPGNHDWDYSSGVYYPPDTLAGYLTYFTNVENRRYYEKRFGPAHFFFLDSGYDSAGNMLEPDGNTPGTFDSNGNPVGGSIQWQWFVEKVRASDAPWKFALAHHSDLTSGSSHGPYPALAWQWERLGIAIRFAGHEHSYERLKRGATTWIVNGAGGQALTGFGAFSPYSLAHYNALHGALRLEITREKVLGRFVSTDGVTQDSFTLTK
jgi:hypothetical protein